MACNTPTNEERNVQESDSTDQETLAGRDQAEEKVKHCFSEPWEDSDVILVVENDKFHVHRLILSMNSPVFKAMFKSEFQESTNNEIPLPGKKAVGVLDFLKIIYGCQYIKEQVEITMENVEHLIKLSDEYQVKQHIFDPCVKFLEDQPKTKENVMKILSLAKLFNLEKVRQGCIDFLRDLKLEFLSETVHLQDLDKEETQYYLTQRIERLETFIDDLYPQFMGLVPTLIWLLTQANKCSWQVLCKDHVTSGKLDSSISSSVIRKCSNCSRMLESMINVTTTKCYGHEKRHPLHGYSSLHFDSNLFSVMDDLSKLK